MSREIRGWLAVLLLLAPFLSVSVGILNLLPVPPLDGGHMLFLTIEGTIRRDLSLKIKETILMMGLGLLLLLIVFVFYSDLTRNKLFGFSGTEAVGGDASGRVLLGDSLLPGGGPASCSPGRARRSYFFATPQVGRKVGSREYAFANSSSGYSLARGVSAACGSACL